MQELASCGIFHGSSGKLAFTCTLPLLADEKYRLAGQLVQWSIQHGGPGIPVLSEQQYCLMLGHQHSVDNVSVPDTEVAEILQLVSSRANYRYTVSPKNALVTTTSPISTDFHNSFTAGKFVIFVDENNVYIQ